MVEPGSEGAILQEQRGDEAHAVTGRRWSTAEGYFMTWIQIREIHLLL